MSRSKLVYSPLRVDIRPLFEQVLRSLMIVHNYDVRTKHAKIKDWRIYPNILHISRVATAFEGSGRLTELL